MPRNDIYFDLLTVYFIRLSLISATIQLNSSQSEGPGIEKIT